MTAGVYGLVLALDDLRGFLGVQGAPPIPAALATTYAHLRQREDWSYSVDESSREDGNTNHAVPLSREVRVLAIKHEGSCTC